MLVFQSKWRIFTFILLYINLARIPAKSFCDDFKNNQQLDLDTAQLVSNKMV